MSTELVWRQTTQHPVGQKAKTEKHPHGCRSSDARPTTLSAQTGESKTEQQRQEQAEEYFFGVRTWQPPFEATRLGRNALGKECWEPLPQKTNHWLRKATWVRPPG